MKYFFVLLCLLFSFSVNAQIGVSSVDSLPQCTNPQLIEAVQKKLQEYFYENSANDIITKRRQALILKNIDSFGIVDLFGFKPSDNYKVASFIMNKKMNSSLKEEDMRLCKNETDNVLSEVYIIMYPFGKFIRATLINFLPDNQELVIDFSMNPLE